MAKPKKKDEIVEEQVATPETQAEAIEEAVVEDAEESAAGRVVKKSHCEYGGVIYASPRKALDAAKVPNAHKKAGKLLVKMRKAGGTVEFEGHTFTEVPYGTAEGKIAEWVGAQPEAIADRDAKKLKAAGVSDGADDVVDEEEPEEGDED
jgi:hypothetical protein